MHATAENVMETDQYIPIYIRLREQLRKLIAATAPGESLPTITQIKKQFGVSQPTVERAIQDLRAEGLITSRRGSGIYVTERAKLIDTGVIFDADILSAEFGDFYRFLVKSLQRQSDGTPLVMRHYIADLLAPAEQDPRSAVFHDLRDGRLDALIILAAYWRRMVRSSIPIIGFGHLPQTTHRVHLDHAATIRQGIRALANQGCRHIGFLRTIVPPRIEPENRAFEESLAEVGVVSRPEWIQTVSGWGATEAIRSGMQALRTIWSASEQKPDGLVSVDEYGTRGALDAAHELGITVGNGLRIASHATRGAALLAQAPVTLIEFDPADVARQMVALIVAIANGTAVPTDVLVPPCAVGEAT